MYIYIYIHTCSAQCRDPGRAKEIGTAVNAACQGNLSCAILGTCAIASTALLYTHPVYTLLLPDEQTGEAWEPSETTFLPKCGSGGWQSAVTVVVCQEGIFFFNKKIVISS